MQLSINTLLNDMELPLDEAASVFSEATETSSVKASEGLRSQLTEEVGTLINEKLVNIPHLRGAIKTAVTILVFDDPPETFDRFKVSARAWLARCYENTRKRKGDVNPFMPVLANDIAEVELLSRESRKCWVLPFVRTLTTLMNIYITVISK